MATAVPFLCRGPRRDLEADGAEDEHARVLLERGEHLRVDRRWCRGERPVEFRPLDGEVQNHARRRVDEWLRVDLTDPAEVSLPSKLRGNAFQERLVCARPARGFAEVRTI